MAKYGPIVFIEDDPDDQDFVREIVNKMQLDNELIFFESAIGALEYLYRDYAQPFIIVSDVNLPGMSGLDLKKQIDSDPYLREKSIPFVFLSTSVAKAAVDTAYKNMTVQGFFEKRSQLAELENAIRLILEYWKICKHPNSD